MKILHLISGGDVGGARTHIHLLLKHLNEDNEATLVCFMRAEFSRGAEELGIPTVVIEKPFPAAVREVLRLVREGGYDLLHCHGSRGNLMGAVLRRRCDLPVISTVHSDPRLDYLGRFAARWTYGVLNSFALRRMDYWIGVSDAMRELLISRGFDANRVYAIYNGVEFDGIAPPKPGEREAYYREVGLDAPPECVVAGIGARLDPVKDMSTLLRGFARAHERFPRLRLLIAGDGPEKASLEALAIALGVEKAVCFAGWQEDMERFYRCIDINTLTSLYETFSYAVTEGARQRVPVISTRVGGLPRLVIPGETGYLFEPGDDEALGEYLSALAADASLRKRLGDALYEKTRREYSAAATAARQLEIYRHVLDSYRLRNTRRGVAVCGAYGMKNAGDEAVLDAVCAEMRQIDPWMPVTVVSRDPADTRTSHSVTAVHSFWLPGVLRTFGKSRLYINGGGSLMQDVTSSRSLWYYLFTLWAAKKRGCRVMMYGCGVGPVRRPFNRRLAARIINRCVDAVTLREEGSLRELREMGVTLKDIAVAAEPALSLRGVEGSAADALLRRLGLEPEGRYFCLCIRRWPGIARQTAMFSAAAEYARSRYGLTPVIFAVNLEQDVDLARQIARGASVPCGVVTEALTTPEVIGFFSRMTAVMAMRLHALIFSASQSVPLVGLSYDPKVRSFLDSVHQTNYIDIEDLTRPEQLCQMLDVAMASSREDLQRAASRLMDRERLNVETAARLYVPGGR